MSYEFTKLSDVPVVDSFPVGANTIIETNGEIRRCTSAIGGGGITPTIGDNGNWYLGDTDTGKPSRGDTGKSAYAYAAEGGYTGTETEFAAKLAQEIPSDDHINSLIDTKLGVIENGSY